MMSACPHFVGLERVIDYLWMVMCRQFNFIHYIQSTPGLCYYVRAQVLHGEDKKIYMLSGYV